MHWEIHLVFVQQVFHLLVVDLEVGNLDLHFRLHFQILYVLEDGVDDPDRNRKNISEKVISNEATEKMKGIHKALVL